MRNSRRVGDRFTWILPFDNTEVDRAETPDSVLEYATWSLSKNHLAERHQNLCCYETVAYKFSALTLKYRYIYSHEPDGFWIGLLGSRMHRLSVMELYKIPVSSRSPLIQQAIDHDRKSVRYVEDELARCEIKIHSYDHMIPVWYAEWEKQKASKVEGLSENSRSC